MIFPKENGYLTGIFVWKKPVEATQPHSDWLTELNDFGVVNGQRWALCLGNKLFGKHSVVFVPVIFLVGKTIPDGLGFRYV